MSDAHDDARLPLLDHLRERRGELDAQIRDAESRRAEIDLLLAAAEDGRSKLRRSLKGNSRTAPTATLDLTGTQDAAP